MTRVRIRPSVPLLLLLAFAACDETPPPQVASVRITPGAPALVSLGESVQLQAVALDPGGDPIDGAQITWTSSDDAVAAVSPTGEVTAFANGSAEIRARAMTSGAEADGTATVTVQQRAAAVSVAAPRDTLTAGETMQLSAAAEDANDNPITGRAFTWTSADEAVATVSATGEVAAVGKGTVAVRAAMDGAGADADVTVLFVSVTVASDTTLTGSVVVDSFTVAAGATVTAGEDFTLAASGPVTIAGAVTGDCVAVAIAGESHVTITGSVANGCSDSTAVGRELRIAAGGDLSLDGAALTASGDVVITNQAPAASGSGAAALRAYGAAGAPARVVGDGTCSFRAVILAWKPARAPEDQDGGNLGIQCRSTATFHGGNQIQAQHGGPGEDDDEEDLAEGEDGGLGGGVRIEVAQGDLIFLGETHNGTLGTGLVAGDGGEGGEASAVAEDPGGSAEAIGGDGGAGGSVSLEALGGSIRIEAAGALRPFIGRGGDGGEGYARGVDGEDAGAVAAQDGGAAIATGGDGGAAGSWSVSAIGGSTEGVVDVVQGGGDGGHGGDADANSGDGGDGNEAFPDGARGGDLEADGGTGADAATGPGLGFLGDGGWGGDIEFDGGRGGAGFPNCPDGAGGNGGAGGNAEGETGDGGGGMEPGESGDWEVGDGTGDGGPGGAGDPGGAGGEGGDEDVDGDHPNAFRDGPPGGGCVTESTIGVSVTVASDPAGHNPYVGMYQVGSVTVRVDGGTITITGGSPWITVAGTVDANGGFDASGSGTAAGVSNVSTTFTGSVSRNAAGAVNGIEGTLTVGTNGELYGTPITYSVSG